MPSRWTALVIVASIFVISCGKRRVDPLRETEDGLERWDPPTSEFGFHPVGQAECLPVDAGRFAISDSQHTTMEEVTSRSEDRWVRSVAALQPLTDGSHGAIFFTESARGKSDDEHGSIHRAVRLRDHERERERGRSRSRDHGNGTDARDHGKGTGVRDHGNGTDGGTDKWQVTDLATNEVEPDELAIATSASGRRLYWVSKNLLTQPPSYNIRFIHPEAQHPIPETLSVETTKPSRVITRGPHVFWIAGNHIRELNENENKNENENEHGRGEVGPLPEVAPLSGRALPVVVPSPVHERYAGTLTQGLLAADDEAVYAFTGDESLLRIPLVGGRPAIVLVPTTRTTPIDLAVHGSWVYWLEQGSEIVRCGSHGGVPCHSGYQMKSSPSHKGATLRRVPVTGGNVEAIATDLIDVERLTIHPRTGALWLTTTSGGPVHISPTGRFQDHVEHATVEHTTIHPYTRMTTYSDALVLLTRTDSPSTPNTTKLVLLHSF